MKCSDFPNEATMCRVCIRNANPPSQHNWWQRMKMRQRAAQHYVSDDCLIEQLRRAVKCVLYVAEQKSKEKPNPKRRPLLFEGRIKAFFLASLQRDQGDPAYVLCLRRALQTDHPEFVGVLDKILVLR
jgi:hypothetical protein